MRYALGYFVKYILLTIFTFFNVYSVFVLFFFVMMISKADNSRFAVILMYSWLILPVFIMIFSFFAYIKDLNANPKLKLLIYCYISTCAFFISSVAVFNYSGMQINMHRPGIKTHIDTINSLLADNKEHQANEKGLFIFIDKFSKCLKEKDEICIKNHVADGIYFPVKLSDDELSRCVGKDEVDKIELRYGLFSKLKKIYGAKSSKRRVLSSADFTKCLLAYNNTKIHWLSHYYARPRLYKKLKNLKVENKPLYGNEWMYGVFKYGGKTNWYYNYYYKYHDNYFSIGNHPFGACVLFYDKNDQVKWKIIKCYDQKGKDAIGLKSNVNIFRRVLYEIWALWWLREKEDQ